MALLLASVSGPAIRFAAAPALAVVFWRVALSWPLVACIALARRERWPLVSGGGAGFFLALHWLAWVTAVQTTTLSSAALLISTGSLWTALLSRPLLGERVPSSQWIGLGVALAGVALVVTVPEAGSRHTVHGDLMALAGAMAWTAYTFIGRRARRESTFWGYLTVVYLGAGLAITAAALAGGVALLGFDPRTWAALAVLALLPTLAGHGSYNYLLKHMGPARLSLYTLVEPVLATLAAWPLFGEVPGGQLLLGGAVTLLGVALGAYPRE